VDVLWLGDRAGWNRFLGLWASRGGNARWFLEKEGIVRVVLRLILGYELGRGKVQSEKCDFIAALLRSGFCEAELLNAGAHGGVSSQALLTTDDHHYRTSIPYLEADSFANKSHLQNVFWMMYTWFIPTIQLYRSENMRWNANYPPIPVPSAVAA
jgi:hypothetical protein